MAASLVRISFLKSCKMVTAAPWRNTATLSYRIVKRWPLYLSTEFTFPCSWCRHLHLTSVAYKRRKTAEERKAPKMIEYSPKSKTKFENTVDIWWNMTVEELADVLGKGLDHVFEVMMFVDNSVQYTQPHSVIDNPQVIKEIVKKSGMRFRVVAPPDHKVPQEKNRDVERRPPPDPADTVKRPPVVTVMGHVDHGKTTLLDSLRHTSVVDSEFGGITQHIGAFSVRLDSGDTITFLDTPGHAAFTAMRARGAEVTDIVVLVVAADDGVMEQTVESIRMAREANVPIIVAVNKIDKPEADIERTKHMLMTHGIQTEDAGGDVQAIPVSALQGKNLDLLSEAIVLQAELMDLRGDPHGMVEGVVIESCTDPHRGRLATVIVKRGTLRKGKVLVAGLSWARVRAMFNEQGQPVEEAPPSTPVEVLGWRELPSAGDEILEVESEKRAHEVMRWRKNKHLAEKQEIDEEAVKHKMEQHLEVYKAFLQKKRMLGRFKLRREGPREKQFKEDNFPKVSIVVKGDVDGSVEAILDILETYDESSNCKLDLVHYGVGNISENDVEMAEAFKAIVYAFNVQTPDKVKQMARARQVPIKPHNIIYKLVDDLKEEINKKLPVKDVEEVIGEANVLQNFQVTEGKKKVMVAGARCTKGQLKKASRFRLIRGQDVVYEGTVKSMRHLKSEVDSVKKDIECGICLGDPTIVVQPGDTIQCYEMHTEPQETSWNPGF